MATSSLKLSSKKGDLHQIIVRLTITRENRPCFKSGVFIRPEWFKPKETSRGLTYEVMPPKKGKLNQFEVEQAERAKSNLYSFIARLEAVANALKEGNEVLTHKSIEDAMSLVCGIDAKNISYFVIQEKRRKKEEEKEGPRTMKTFFEWTEEYMKKKEVSEGRKRGFRVLVRILARYENFVRMTDNERKDFTLDIDTIDRETIEDFFDYMANEKALSEEFPSIFQTLLSDYPAEFTPKHKKSKIEARGKHIITNRKNHLRAFFNWLDENNYTNNRPFKGIKISHDEYGTPFFLTLEERNTIADWDFSDNKALEQQRDIFIFQCLIGCRVSDLLKMTYDNISTIDGVLNVSYIPRKTKDKKSVVVYVPLNNRARALVEKYKGLDVKGRLFPFIEAQNYNNAIKKVLTACNINRKVTVVNPTTGEPEQRPINEIASSHMARRTFIGNLYKKTKDPNIIGKMSGHAEGSRAFSRYRDIDMDVMNETIALID